MIPSLYHMEIEARRSGRVEASRHNGEGEPTTLEVAPTVLGLRSDVTYRIDHKTVTRQEALLWFARNLA